MSSWQAFYGAVRERLSQCGWSGLRDLELAFAPGGGFALRHLDVPLVSAAMRMERLAQQMGPPSPISTDFEPCLRAAIALWEQRLQEVHLANLWIGGHIGASAAVAIGAGAIATPLVGAAFAIVPATLGAIYAYSAVHHRRLEMALKHISDHI